MAEYYIAPKSSFDATADAIREKTGSQATIEWTEDGFADAIETIPSGGGDTFAMLWKRNTPCDYENSEITSISLDYLFYRSSLRNISLPNLENGQATETATSSPSSTFNASVYLKKVYLPKLRTGSQTASGWYNCPGYMFSGCTALEYADSDTIGGRNTAIGASVFVGCSALTICDFRIVRNMANYVFRNCTNFSTLCIRNSDSICSLGNINAFEGSPFANGGTGGTLYVPESLISTYQSATNWSTILGYTNNQIKSIESTHTDPNAPIDLTLYYADGTPIPTT